jgi:hypothetical protein
MNCSNGEAIDFYLPFFPTEADTRTFVQACEDLAPPHNTAKIMMHQGQRLVSISDDVPRIRPHCEQLRLLFLLMCAENIAKLHDGFQGEGQSRAYVLRFFEQFLSDTDRYALGASFVDHSHPRLRRLGLRNAIDILYKVRCDVVHEGNYWDFSFHDGTTPMLNTDPDVISNITFDQFRTMVVRGCIKAVQDRLQAP